MPLFESPKGGGGQEPQLMDVGVGVVWAKAGEGRKKRKVKINRRR